MPSRGLAAERNRPIATPASRDPIETPSPPRKLGQFPVRFSSRGRISAASHGRRRFNRREAPPGEVGKECAAGRAAARKGLPFPPRDRKRVTRQPSLARRRPSDALRLQTAVGLDVGQVGVGHQRSLGKPLGFSGGRGGRFNRRADAQSRQRSRRLRGGRLRGGGVHGGRQRSGRSWWRSRSRCRLGRCRLGRCRLERCRLEGCRLERCRLERCRLGRRGRHLGRYASLFRLLGGRQDRLADRPHDRPKLLVLRDQGHPPLDRLLPERRRFYVVVFTRNPPRFVCEEVVQHPLNA